MRWLVALLALTALAAPAPAAVLPIGCHLAADEDFCRFECVPGGLLVAAAGPDAAVRATCGPLLLSCSAGVFPGCFALTAQTALIVGTCTASGHAVASCTSA